MAYLLGARLIAKIDSSGTKYYHQDHLSNRMVTDASGTKVAEMGTFPYGESWYNATSDKLVFTTYYRDYESGNDYAQARYNVSGLGRFSSPDPIVGSTSDPQSFNRYSYVRNMPVMLTDPSGLIPSCTTLDNRSPEFFSSGPTWGGGPSDASLSSEAEALPPSGCGGPPPCQYTFAGCGGGFGGDDGGDGGAGLGGLFPGDGGGGFGGAGSGLGDFGPFGFFGGGDPSGSGGWAPGFGPDPYGPLPDCFPFFSDGAGFSVMAGNCGSQSGSSGGGNSSGDPQRKNPCQTKSVLHIPADLQQAQLNTGLGFAVTEISFAVSGDVNGFNLVVGPGSNLNISGATLQAGSSVNVQFNGQQLSVGAVGGNILLSQPGSSLGASISAVAFHGGAITSLSGNATFYGVPIPLTSSSVMNKLNSTPSVIAGLNSLQNFVGKCASAQ